MAYVKPLFRVDRRPIAKVVCDNIPFGNALTLLPIPCPDLDGDGNIGGLELAGLLAGWGSTDFDLNGDGITDGSDLAELLSQWGPFGINCENWPSTIEERICNAQRRARGVASLCQPNGFSLFFSKVMDKLYLSGFRRFIIQCPSGILNNNLSSNVVGAFDNFQTYSIKTTQSNQLFECEEESLPFDPSNALDGSFHKGFGSRLRSWIDSKHEPLEIYIESCGKVLYEGDQLDINNITIRANPENSSFQNFDPNNQLHHDWLVQNSFYNYKSYGISLSGIENQIYNTFVNFKNINEAIWKIADQEFIAFPENIFAQGSGISFSDYAKCRLGFNYDLANSSAAVEGAKLFQYNTEIHSFSENLNRPEQYLYELAYNYGFVPSAYFKYNSQIDISVVSNYIEKAMNAVESAEKQIDLEFNGGRKLKIFSEHAGNTSDPSGIPSSQNEYLRSNVYESNEKIIPVIKVNCSKFVTLETDIARTYIPSWWFTNNRDLRIDPSMVDDFVSTNWTIPNSDNILKVINPSPYFSTGPEKCADAAFDLCLQYQNFYNGSTVKKIDFNKQSNFVIKLENWGDLFDHLCNDVEDSLQEGWCRLFTHPRDGLSPYFLQVDEIHPISKLKNLFAENGTIECKKWIKRFIERFKWRQANLAVFDGDKIVPNPKLIYIDKPEVLNVKDFLDYKEGGDQFCSQSPENIYAGIFGCHVEDERWSNPNLGFKWRGTNSLSEAFEASRTEYRDEFSVFKVDESTNQVFGQITPNIYYLEVAYQDQKTAALEKWLNVLIDEVVARRVYESFGSLVELGISGSRYAQKNFTGILPESGNNSNIHAPFYKFVNNWQYYAGKYRDFDGPKSASFTISYLYPSSIAMGINVNFPWGVEYPNNLRFEVTDYYSNTFSNDYIKKQWGWPINYGEEPSGRGKFLYTSGSGSWPAGESEGEGHRAAWRQYLKFNHRNYTKYLTNTIDALDSDSNFKIKTKVIFSPALNNSFIPRDLGDLAEGTQEGGVESEGYIINKNDFIYSWYSYFQRILNANKYYPDVLLINANSKMSVFDWREFSSGINEAITYSPPSSGIPGDFNGNGVVDAQDLATLLANWGPVNSAESQSVACDLNNDGKIDGADLTTLLSLWPEFSGSSSSSSSLSGPSSSSSFEESSSSSSLIPGDLDGDGIVGSADLTIFLSCWGQDATDLCSRCDFDGNGVIDSGDLTFFLSQWSAPLPSSSSMSSGSSSSSQTIVIGDFDGDGIAGPADLTILLGCFNQEAIGECEKCDLDDDGTVGPGDLTIFLSSWSYSFSSSSSSGVFGDFNRNGVVDAEDLATLLANWGPVNPANPQSLECDLDRDGIVGPADLTTLLSEWPEVFVSSSSSMGMSSSSSSFIDIDSLTQVIKIRADANVFSNPQSLDSWTASIENEQGLKVLKIKIKLNSSPSYQLFKQFELNNKFIGDLSKEITETDGLFSEIINNSDISSANDLLMQNNLNYDFIDDYAILYSENPVTNFTGFENPFNIISIEGTVNDYSLIGNNSISQNYGKFASFSPILASSNLSSVIGGSSEYFTVTDNTDIMSQFDKVSINGEIIKVKSWQGNKAEILERGSNGTAKRFHVKNSSVFGLKESNIFNNNFYIDNNSDSLYQYICLSIRNRYEHVSIKDFSIEIMENYNPYISKLYFAYEMPINKNISLGTYVGSGTSTINISTENFSSYVIGGNIQNLSGCIMRFADSNGSLIYRSIASINNSFINLDQPLPSPAGQYSSINILPGPASSSYQGKIAPIASPRITQFVEANNLKELEIPLVSYNMSRVIEYNNIIYLWIKREVPKNSRISFETSLPIRIKFKMQ